MTQEPQSIVMGGKYNGELYLAPEFLYKSPTKVSKLIDTACRLCFAPIPTLRGIAAQSWARSYDCATA